MQYPGIEHAVRSQSKWFRKSASMEDVSFAAAFMMQNDNLTGCFGPLRDQYINYNLRIGKEAAGDARTVQEVKFSLSAP